MFVNNLLFERTVVTQLYSVGGLKIPFPFMVGAGACKYANQLAKYQRPDVSVGAVVFGSITPEESLGNPEAPLFWPEDWDTFTRHRIMVNAFGMPNDGTDKSFTALNTMQLVHPCIVSIAAKTIEEYLALLLKAEGCSNVAAIEINLGCGNKGYQPHGYRQDFIQGLLQGITGLVLRGMIKKPIWLKLVPYITDKKRDELATAYPMIDFSAAPTVKEGFAMEVVRTTKPFPFVKALIFSNTLSGCLVLHNDQPVTGPFGGRAGLSGPIMMEISLDLIKQAKQVIDPWEDISLIHSGGVLTGDDATRCLQYADAVQCVTGPFLHNNDPHFFADLIARSEELQKFLTHNH